MSDFPDKQGGGHEPGPGAALATVGWYLHPVEAQIVRGRLEAEGIPAFLHTLHHAHAQWPLALALGGIRLQVPASAAAEAVRILAAVQPLPDEDEDRLCPSCGGAEIHRSSLSWRIALLVVHFLYIPLPFRREKYRCGWCRHSWH